MSIMHMLNSTMTVTRPASSTSAGTHADTYNAHLSGIACRWHQLNPSEAIQYGAERGVNLWRGSCDAGNDLARRDRCVFTDDQGSHTVDVEQAWDSSGMAIIRVMIAREVT